VPITLIPKCKSQPSDYELRKSFAVTLATPYGFVDAIDLGVFAENWLAVL
jgi:hypothetical protein